LDEKLLLLINREWTSPALDRLMAIASSWDAWLPLFFLIGAVLLVRGGFRVRAFVLVALLVVAVNDGIIVRVMKRMVDRPRPHQSHNDVRIVDLAKARPRLLAFAKAPKVKLSRISLDEVEGRSFPSAHTVNLFSLSLIAVAFFGGTMGWMFGIAALVGYSRIYTGSHWPSDVLTSICLAFGTTLLLLALFEWAWRRYGARVFPAVHAGHPSLLAR
jgi:undecaprenyl-diphosphatase